MQTFPEFSLNEFATTEFSLESQRDIYLSTFEASASSSANFDGSLALYVLFTGEGLSSFTPQTNFLSNTQYISGSTGLFDAQANAYANAFTRVKGTASSEFTVSFVELTDFDIAGSSFVEFTSSADLFINLVGKATFTVFSAADKFFTPAIKGESITSFFGQAVKDTRYSVFSSANSSVRANAVKDSRYFTRHRATGKFTAHFWVVSSFNETGNSTLSIQIHPILVTGFGVTGTTHIEIETKYLKIGNTVYIITGQGDAVFEGNPKVYVPSEYQGYGESFLYVPANVVKDSSYLIEGVSEMLMYRGAQVMDYLPPAYTSLIRPYENREVLWR